AACSACSSAATPGSTRMPRPWPATAPRSTASSTRCSNAASTWRPRHSRPASSPAPMATRRSRRPSKPRAKPSGSPRQEQAMRLETLAVHAGAETDAETGAVAPPIHLSTTFRHGPAAERIAGYEYQREGNPTQDRLETALAALEGGEAALVFASGMAAIAGLLETLPGGSRVLLPDDCYSGLRYLANEFLPQRGVAADFIDMADIAAVEAAFARPATLLWLETPSNPLMKVCDIAALARLAHANGALVAVDNTFATPVLQQPLALGADVV